VGGRRGPGWGGGGGGGKADGQGSLPAGTPAREAWRDMPLTKHLVALLGLLPARACHQQLLRHAAVRLRTRFTRWAGAVGEQAGGLARGLAAAGSGSCRCESADGSRKLQAIGHRTSDRLGGRPTEGQGRRCLPSACAPGPRRPRRTPALARSPRSQLRGRSARSSRRAFLGDRVTVPSFTRDHEVVVRHRCYSCCVEPGRCRESAVDWWWSQLPELEKIGWTIVRQLAG
jgi:hypothetical protein